MNDMASKYRALGDKAKAMMFDESFQQYFYDAAKEFVRLTAELEHHKGKAEVWEDAARAAQAKVEELEGLLNDPVRLRERIQMMLDIEALAATEPGR